MNMRITRVDLPRDRNGQTLSPAYEVMNVYVYIYLYGLGPPVYIGTEGD